MSAEHPLRAFIASSPAASSGREPILKRLPPHPFSGKIADFPPTLDKMIPFVERETRLHTCQPINDRPCPFECVARLVEIAGGARFENHPYTLPSSVDNVSATFVPSVPALAPAIFFANSSTVATGNGIIFTPPDCVS